MISIHHSQRKDGNGKSIFRTLFIPLILVMLFQTVIFYFAAVYGGIEKSLTQNATDILNERLQNRSNEFETFFNNTWTNFDTSSKSIDTLYTNYTNTYGKYPFENNTQNQIDFLEDAEQIVIDALRQDEVNGVFLILNDQVQESDALNSDNVQKYGLCIRDMDQKSTYHDTEDLLIERAPSSVTGNFNCSLDSWWEAQYQFSSKENGDFYFMPLEAAYQNADVACDDLAYFSMPHQLSNNDPTVVSYSIPLFSEDGHPYAVLGIELTTKYLATLLPGSELNNTERGCYVVAMQNEGSTDCIPITYSGALFNRCFDSSSVISTANTNDIDGFDVTGRGGVDLYGSKSPLTIYNNNNPFEAQQLVLIALEEKSVMFAYIDHIKQVLLLVALLTLLLGSVCILVISRRFAKPITALATRVEHMTPESGFNLGRLGINEIDQLVDSIETLNRNVSKNTARTEFFSRMSHDMRTPMNAIISFSSSELLEDSDEMTKDNYLEKIHSSGEYLLGLINEVLDMTKIESKKTELVCEPIPFSHIWITIVPIIDKLAQKKQINFVKDISDLPDLYIYADEQHLTQIIINLLSNAVKFTPVQGEVDLTVKIEQSLNPLNQIRCQITVTDNGIGISEEFMKNLYTPFEQENEGKEGTGLGLSIAKKLVELMGGTIQCESEKGFGTSFYLDIPFEICDMPVVDNVMFENTNAVKATNRTFISDDCLIGKHILVCEDHPLNMQIICKLLEKKGIVVTSTPDGLAGLDAFQSSELHSFDAILMDIRMPNMDGLETTKAIRALTREDAHVIPIIAMTANAFAEDVNASHSAGMNAHLSKPIEPQKLYQTLVQFLGNV